MNAETLHTPHGAAPGIGVEHNEERAKQSRASSPDLGADDDTNTLSPARVEEITPPSSRHSTTMEGAGSSPSAALQAFGQPATTIIELVSTSATASAFPESFGLTISQKGQWIAAYTSTALYIISSAHLPAVQGRFFKVRRKPIAMAISDEPQALAILSNPHNVDVYSMSGEDEEGPWRNLKQRSIILGHEITSIALSPDGKILAAGYRGGIEVIACGLDVADSQRRQISCEPMAEVAFSHDGRTLIATSTAKKTRPSTVISVGSTLDGPMFDEGIMEPLPADRAWISQLLFPERATHARQAAMLPDSDGVVAELFAFNAEEDSWGIYDLNMKKFTDRKVDVLNLAPTTHKMQYEAAVPAVSPDFNQVTLCTRHTGRTDILVYRMPYGWRDGSTSSPTSPTQGGLAPKYSVSLTKTEEAAAESVVALRWLANNGGSAPSTRLIALATSAAHPVDEDVDEIPPAASGRIILVDLAGGHPTSSPRRVTINFDELPQESLGDERMDFESEVSLVRSRTQMLRRRSSGNSTAPRLSRSSTSHGYFNRLNGLLSPSDLSETSLTRRHSLSSITSDDTETSFGALVLPPDEPYSQSQPRSQFSLQRAATMSQRSGANRRHLLALPDRPLEFRRADGSRGLDLPHESDADNWVPPPPPYSRHVDPSHSRPVTATPTVPQLNTSIPRTPGARTSPLSDVSPTERTFPPGARSSPALVAALPAQPVAQTRVAPRAAPAAASPTVPQRVPVGRRTSSQGTAVAPPPNPLPMHPRNLLPQHMSAASQDQHIALSFNPLASHPPLQVTPGRASTLPQEQPVTLRSPSRLSNMSTSDGASISFPTHQPTWPRASTPTRTSLPPGGVNARRITQSELQRPLPPLPGEAGARFSRAGTPTSLRSYNEFPWNITNDQQELARMSPLPSGRRPQEGVAGSTGHEKKESKKKGSKCIVM